MGQDSKTIDDGGPAKDMSVRAWLAGQALAGIEGNKWRLKQLIGIACRENMCQQDAIAKVCLGDADAIIAASKEPRP